MTAIVEAACAAWGLEGVSVSLAAERENRVYKVMDGPQTLALRVRRRGYRTRREIASELAWMRALSRAGLRVPEPIASLAGSETEHIAGHDVDLVTWLPGRPLGEAADPLCHGDRLGTLRAVGRAAAGLHIASDAWQPPDEFQRAAWDAEGLLGEAPLWGRFWENPAVPPATAERLRRFRQAARADLAARGASLEFGLIHADLVGENVLISDTGVAFIDFDDGGPGYRLFELATLLNRLRGQPDFAELQRALVEGYREVRPIDTGPMTLMIALRAVTYLGWILPRMGEPGAEARLARFIPNAETAVDRYLGGTE